MEGFQRVIDELLWLHKEAAPITSTQDGSVATVAKIHNTGPGIWAPGTYLLVNVTAADDTTGDETYTLALLCRQNGGSFVNFGTWEIPRGTVGVLMVPVTNRYWDGTAYDEVKVNLALGGTTPILDATVRLCVTGI